MRILIKVEGGVVQDVYVDSSWRHEESIRVYIHDLDNVAAGEPDKAVEMCGTEVTIKEFNTLGNLHE